MTFKQLLKYFGTRRAIYQSLKPPITKGALTDWPVTGVPELRQRQFEEVTNGELKMDKKFHQGNNK